MLDLQLMHDKTYSQLTLETKSYRLNRFKMQAKKFYST